MLRRCDASLKATRGAVAALLRIELQSHTLSHAAIGNVEVSGLCANKICTVAVPGIVVAGLRKVICRRSTLHPGDMLFVYTDGVSGRFFPSDYAEGAADKLAEAIVAQWGKEHDDATCLVLRY
jgi:hypothetical protein